jgi:sigma-B regulation protein RsbU (phosphoserine phosphatase)
MITTKAPNDLDSFWERWQKFINNDQEQQLFTKSLDKTLQFVIDFFGAEDGTLFVFDKDQELKKSFLTCKIPIKDKDQEKLILGTILEKGLAHWVMEHREIGLVQDTETDPRWITLSDQKYFVRSALCFPLFSETQLLSIITLHHSQPNYFQAEVVEKIKTCSHTLALFVEIACLYLEKTTWQVQQRLLENLVEVARSPMEEGSLRSVLQNTLDLASELTSATKGSMFLINPDTGQIVDAIISRQELSQQSRNKLIGTICDFGFAGWVIKNRQIGIIIDVDQDERWMKIPNDPSQTKSVLAVPIIKSEQVLGIFTLEHIEVAHFTRNIADLMQSTADQMALVLENLRLYYQVKEYASALNQELQKGRNMQLDFLPRKIIQPPNWEISAFFSPAKQLAGDFYDVFTLEDYIGLVIADVCDKGVGSSMFMGLMRSLIRIFSHKAYLGGFSASEVGHRIKNPDTLVVDGIEVDLGQLSGLEAVTLTNQYIADNHWQVNMFATLFFGILNPNNGVLTYINGGHEPLLILREGKIVDSLDSTGPAVGMMPNVKFSVKQVQLQPGDILFGYTDGVTDGKNLDNKLFSRHRLIPLLETPVQSAQELLERVKQNLFDYIGSAPQFDDVTMLIVKRLP